jgi:chemotaxis protein histidine kinase CheA
VSDLVKEFVWDSREHLSTAQQQLLVLEQDPASLQKLNALMGTLHTIKGNSGFVNLRHLYDLLHSAESLLQTVREEGRECPRPVVDSLFQVLDTADAIMGRLENDDDDEVDWMPSLMEALADVCRSLEAGGDGAPPARTESRASYPAASRLQAQDQAQFQPQDPSPEPEPAVASALEPLPEPATVPSAASSGNVGAAFFFDSSSPVQVLTLSNGKMQEEGRGYLEGSREFLDNGAKGLVLDMLSLTSLSTSELRLIRELRGFWGERLAVVASREEQPDLCRIFDVLEPQGFKGLYSDEKEAWDALMLA